MCQNKRVSGVFQRLHGHRRSRCLAQGLLTILTVVSACSEAPLLENNAQAGLNAPVFALQIPGQDLLLALNANINLDEAEGNLLPVQISTQTPLSELAVRIPSLGGTLHFDEGASRLYVTARAQDALLVYDVRIPGPKGEAIAILPVKVPNAVTGIDNGVPMDDEPYGMLQANTSEGNVLLVTNTLEGTVSVLKTDTLEVPDFDPDNNERRGLIMYSALNADQKKNRPARGLSRILMHPSRNQAFISSLSQPHVYVLDLNDLSIEAMLDFSDLLGASGGFRDIGFDASEHLILLYPRLGQLLVTDVSNVTDNGFDQEVIRADVRRILALSGAPEAMGFLPGAQALYVSLLKANRVLHVDLQGLRVVDELTLSGVGPASISFVNAGAQAWVTEFGSNSLAVIDVATFTQTGAVP